MEQPSTSCLVSNPDELKSIDDEHDDFVSRQQQKLLRIFPEEIWMNILERITSTNDVENISNASLLFRRLLSPRTTVIRLANVCKIIASSNCIQNYSDLCTLTKNCRLVCSFWNQTIQEFFIQTQHAPLDASCENRDIIAKVGAITFPTSSSSGIEEFVRDFQQTHYLSLPLGKNPFLGRSVVFDDTLFRIGFNADCGNYLRHFWHDICIFLIKYGRHIWYCKFQLEDKFSCRQEYYHKLSGWLDLVPNLKGLEVNYYCPPKNKIYSTVELKREIAENPLPKLRQLEWLTLNGLPDPISNEFVQRYIHVERISVWKE